MRTVTTSGNLGYMAKAFVPTEIWFTTSSKGKRRAYFWCRLAFRALPYPLADAELAIASGAARETGKPDFVGGRR